MSADFQHNRDAANGVVVAPTEAVRFQRDLYLLWRTVAESRGLPLTARGYVTLPAVRRVRAPLTAADERPHSASDLPEGEDLRLLFLRRLAQRLGLLSTAESRLVAGNREMIERYLALSFAERLRLCVRVWVAGGWWPDVPSSTTPLARLLTPATPRVALARRRLTDSLASLSPGERRSISGGASPQPLERSRRSSAMRRPSSAPDADVATVRAALCGPLAWLGIVAPEARSQAGNAPSDAYTGTAAVVALRQDENDNSLLETPGRVVAQSNFDVLAFPPLTAPTLLLLDTCAREVALDTTARYQLTRESFAQARQRGWGAEVLVARLESLTGVPLPANIRVTLADWERQGKRLTITEEVTVLSVAHAGVLDTLLADRAAVGWIVRRLDSTVALIGAEHAAQVRRWLLRRGELPAETASTREDATD